ncbi:hypothetical protein OQA88_9738 [Cercophora sp. LCS_1]
MPPPPCRLTTLLRPSPIRLTPLSQQQQQQQQQQPASQPLQNRPCIYTQQSRPSSSNSRWKLRQGADHFAHQARVQGLKSRAAFKLLEMDARYRLFKRNQTVVDLGFAPGSWSQVALERTKPNGRVVGIDIIPAQPPKGVSTIQGNFLSESVRGMVKGFLVEGEARRRKKDETAVDEEGKEEVVEERKSYVEMEKEIAKGEEGESEAGEARLVDVVLSDMSAPWPQTHGFSVNSLSNPYRRMMNTSGIAFKDHAGSMDLCHAALTFASDTLKSGGHFVCKFYQGSEDKAFENLLKKMFTKVHREKPESSRSESKEAYFVALKRKGDVTLGDIESA